MILRGAAGVLLDRTSVTVGLIGSTGVLVSVPLNLPATKSAATSRPSTPGIPFAGGMDALVLGSTGTLTKLYARPAAIHMVRTANAPAYDQRAANSPAVKPDSRLKKPARGSIWA